MIRDNRFVRPFTVAVVVVSILLVTGCRREHNTPQASEAFCKASTKYEERIQKGAGVDEQIRLVEHIVDAAPKTIEADAQAFLDALRRVKNDPSVKNDPNVKKAVEAVERYAARGCGFYERPGGGI